MKFDRNLVILLIVALLIALGAFWYFSVYSGNQPPLSGSAQAPSAAEQQFETLIGEIQPITFDTSIFSDPNFQALIDLSTPVQPEAVGRPDPFAPIPGVSTTP